MAVMVTLTIKTDVATSQRLHGQMLAMARSAGLLFHSGREVPDGIAVVDFWPSEEAFRSFRFCIPRSAECLICRPGAEPCVSSSEELDVALDQALARLGNV